MHGNDKNQVLSITYFNPDRSRFALLSRGLDNQKKEKYFNPPFKLLQNSIAIKRRLISEMIKNVNIEMETVNKLLKEDESCMSSNNLDTRADFLSDGFALSL